MQMMALDTAHRLSEVCYCFFFWSFLDVPALSSRSNFISVLTFLFCFSLSLFYAFAAPKLDSTSVKANVRVLLKFFRMFRSAMAGNGGSWFFFSREFRIVSRKSSQLFKSSERQRSGHRTLQQNRFICILIYYFPIFKNVFL